MKVLLTAYVFLLNPATHKLEFMWVEVVPQESMAVCAETGAKYKYLVERVDNVEVQYYCNGKKVTS